MSDKVFVKHNHDAYRDFDENQTLEMNVKRALYSHTEFAPNQIITQSNKFKYHDADRPMETHDYLGEIVDAMASLNRQGLSLDDLGRINGKGVSFKDALDMSVQKIADRLNGKGLIYVELGPEPVKTGFILNKLLEHGVKIARYISVDINPASEAPLRPIFEAILNDTPVEFVTASFEDFSLDAYLGITDEPALITMLGFQEGNDDPHTITHWLKNIARKDDYLLSEVQLFGNTSASSISSFYRNPMMQRFSRIAFEQANKNSALSIGRFYLLPVQTSSGDFIFTAILCEEFMDQTRQRKLFVSNYCLKFDYSQYQEYREIKNHFKTVEETLTEDQTLLFQISMRG
jgi:hypothetical protein